MNADGNAGLLSFGSRWANFRGFPESGRFIAGAAANGPAAVGARSRPSGQAFGSKRLAARFFCTLSAAETTPFIAM
jgi:hypothetical protein